MFPDIRQGSFFLELDHMETIAHTNTAHTTHNTKTQAQHTTKGQKQQKQPWGLCPQLPWPTCVLWETDLLTNREPWSACSGCGCREPKRDDCPVGGWVDGRNEIHYEVFEQAKQAQHARARSCSHFAIRHLTKIWNFHKANGGGDKIVWGVPQQNFFFFASFCLYFSGFPVKVLAMSVSSSQMSISGVGSELSTTDVSISSISASSKGAEVSPNKREIGDEAVWTLSSAKLGSASKTLKNHFFKRKWCWTIAGWTSGDILAIRRQRAPLSEHYVPQEDESAGHPPLHGLQDGRELHATEDLDSYRHGLSRPQRDSDFGARWTIWFVVCLFCFCCVVCFFFSPLSCTLTFSNRLDCCELGWRHQGRRSRTKNVLEMCREQWQVLCAVPMFFVCCRCYFPLFVRQALSAGTPNPDRDCGQPSERPRHALEAGADLRAATSHHLWPGPGLRVLDHRIPAIRLHSMISKHSLSFFFLFFLDFFLISCASKTPVFLWFFFLGRNSGIYIIMLFRWNYLHVVSWSHQRFVLLCLGPTHN